MRWALFLKHLAILISALMVWAFIVSSLGSASHTLWMYFIANLSFVTFSVLIFLYAYNTSASDNLFSFNNVVFASFLLKLIMSIGVLMVFERVFSPSGNLHVAHFIFVYIVYTIYEVYFLTKLAKSSE